MTSLSLRIANAVFMAIAVVSLARTADAACSPSKPLSCNFLATCGGKKFVAEPAKAQAFTAQAFTPPGFNYSCSQVQLNVANNTNGYGPNTATAYYFDAANQINARCMFLLWNEAGQVVCKQNLKQTLNDIYNGQAPQAYLYSPANV